MYKNWYHKGIKYLKDIYDDTSKTIYSYDRLQELYQLARTEFLNYLSFILSIPRPNKFVYNLLIAKKPKIESKSEQK